MKEPKKKKKIKLIVIIIIILTLVIGFPIYLNNGYRGKTVECETLGCRLILPDGWDGKCDFVMVDEGIDAYHRKGRISELQGYKKGELFWLRKWKGVFTDKEVQDRALQPTIFMGADNEGAYVIICASSVTSQNFREEYDQLYNEINQIKIEIY
ncbi:MAG: hypothetical protein E7263_08785 [Lachnospiraceae bacterium]|nr:hypothetical protein [Lachnospiraceae bacterium]